MSQDSQSPATTLPVLPLRGMVLLPGATLRIDVGRPRSLALLQGLRPGAELAVAVQRQAAQSDPERDDLLDVGVLARVVDIKRTSGAIHRLTLEGVERLVFGPARGVGPASGVGAGAAALELGSRTAEELRATGVEARELARTLVQEIREHQGGDLADLERIEPSRLADRVAASLGLEFDAATAVLTELDVPTRLSVVLTAWSEARSRADVRKTIDRDVRAQLHKSQREAILREQLRAIKKELGDQAAETPIPEAAWKRLQEKLASDDLPEEVKSTALREIGRLESGGAQGPEANVIRTYLEWIAHLPFTDRATVSTDLGAIARELDADHEGLEDVKKRILEHMAVQKLAGERSGRTKGTLLCLTGPPGVGKTSLGESIARATGRPFARIALGGVRDEAEIRGHRRTYVGALPGRILHAIHKVGAKNPLILLDEIDKLAPGFSGNPESALLEVLDPEQNHTFTDHYLELPFDLSEVFFLCTANDIDRLSPPLRDRLEVVELSGYTRAEKLSIARSHLVPKSLASHGVSAGELTLTDDALLRIIDEYTREAGVRQLGRAITRIARHVALEVAQGDVALEVAQGDVALDVAQEAAEVHRDRVVDVGEVEAILGRPRFQSDVAERTAVPGVATGLAWTPNGGDILFIETSRMPGKGRLEITGQLGDVMRESARAALTYVRSHASELAESIGDLSSEDLHIHVPQGAVPKDGPSAGVTIFTALVSLFTGRRVRGDTAMTGECTLRGRVLPVGGIKAKVLAAHRAGLTRVVLPSRNRRDVDEVPRDVRDALEIVFADDMSDVLAAALEPFAEASADQRTGRPAGTGPVSLSSTFERSTSLP
jgi:ATP-dependent Lon protease